MAIVRQFYYLMWRAIICACFFKEFLGMVEGGIESRTSWMQSKNVNNELLHIVMWITPVIQLI